MNKIEREVIKLNFDEKIYKSSLKSSEELLRIPEASNMVNKILEDISSTLRPIINNINEMTVKYVETGQFISQTLVNVYDEIYPFLSYFAPDDSKNVLYQMWLEDISKKFELTDREFEKQIYMNMQNSGYYFPIELLRYIPVNEHEVYMLSCNNMNYLSEKLRGYIKLYLNDNPIEKLADRCDVEIVERLKQILKIYKEELWYPGTLMMIELNARLISLKSKSKNIDIDAYSNNNVMNIHQTFLEQNVVKWACDRRINYFFTAYLQGKKHCPNSVKNRQHKHTDESNDCGRHHIAHGKANFLDYNEDLFMQHFSYFLVLIDYEVLDMNYNKSVS